MGAQRIVRGNGFGYQIGPGRLGADIHVLSVIAVGPAVKRAVFHRREVIGHQVAADFVALVHHRPKGASVRRPAHAVRVAQATCKYPVGAAFWVYFPDRGAAFLGLHAVFRHVAVGAHGDKKFAAIRAGDNVFRPVVIDGAAGQINDLDRRGADAGLSGLVRDLHQRIGIGNVQVAAHQRHAKRRIQVLQENRAGFGLAVAVHIAQQRDAVG